MTDTTCKDPVVLDQWYAVAAIPEIPVDAVQPCGCPKLCRGWSGGVSVFVDESVAAG